MSNRTYQGPPIDMTYNHLSERNGKTVGGTTDDDKGEIKTDSWPESAPPKDELNEDQIAVVEAVADPTREWESMAELGRKVVPDKSYNYAACFLRKRWPEGRIKVIQDSSGTDEEYTCGRCGKTFNQKTSLTAHKGSCHSRAGRGKSAEEIEKMRRALLDGITTSELSDKFNVSKKQVRRLAKGDYDYIPEDDIGLPPLVSPGPGQNPQYSLPDGYEDTDTATQAELTDDVSSSDESLQSIRGIGPHREEKLKDAGYTTIADIREASAKELCDVARFNERYAKAIKADVEGEMGDWFTVDSGTSPTVTADSEPEEAVPEPEPQPEPEPITSDSDTTDKRSNRLRTVALAILAFIFGWAINK